MSKTRHVLCSFDIGMNSLVGKLVYVPGQEPHSWSKNELKHEKLCMFLDVNHNPKIGMNQECIEAGMNYSARRPMYVLGQEPYFWARNEPKHEDYMYIPNKKHTPKARTN